jgi:hypothetical protein
MEEQKLYLQNVEKVLEAIQKRMPKELLTNFDNQDAQKLYIQLLCKLIEEALPEGSTILQALVVERAAFNFAKMKEIEFASKGKTFTITDDYRFYVGQYNDHLNTLRQFAIRNLPAQQLKVIAKKTLSIIERIIKNPDDKSLIVKELKAEFTFIMPVIGFKKLEANVEQLS